MTKIAFIFPRHILARQAFEQFVTVDSARKLLPQQKVIFHDGIEIHFISLDPRNPNDCEKLGGMSFSAFFADCEIHPIARAFLNSRIREII